MSEQQIIIKSLEMIADKGTDIFPLIYDQYFKTSPAAKQLMIDASPQARGKMLEELMRLLMIEDLSAEKDYLVFETENHEQSYQVMLPMYVSLLAAVVSVINAELGAHWNERYNTAWQNRVTALLAAIKMSSPCPFASQ